MKRNRIMALLLASCMVLGNSNVLLYAEEADEQYFTIEEDNESEIQEDVMEEQVDEEDDLYAGDLIEDEEEVLSAAETADTAPPVIDVDSLKVTYPEGKNSVTAGDVVKISVKATDEMYGSGIDFVRFGIRFPESSRVEEAWTNAAGDNTYECTLTITDPFPSGDWKIQYILANETGKSNTFWQMIIGEINQKSIIRRYRQKFRTGISLPGTLRLPGPTGIQLLR